MHNGWKVSAAALTAFLLCGCGADKYPANEAASAGPALTAPIAPIGPDPGAGPGEGFTHKPSMDNPYEGSQTAREEGRQLFLEMNCYGCHGGHAGGGMGPSLRDPHWIYGSTPVAIYSSIAQGRANGMPAWGLRLPRSEVWKLVSYIRSLGTELEPLPPTPAPAAAPPDAAPQIGASANQAPAPSGSKSSKARG